jgi:hypothetical protein
MASRGDAMREELGWDKPLRYRRGGSQRLRGLGVFYDFRWRVHFPDRRAQFRGGQCLADQVIEDCPEGKRPALLLTDREDVAEGARVTRRSYVVVVNLPRYTASADDANAATAYMARRLGRGITRAKSFSQLSDANAAEVAGWLDENLDASALTSWASDNEQRLELLREIGMASKEDGPEPREVDARSRLWRHLRALTRVLPRLSPRSLLRRPTSKPASTCCWP